MRCEQEVNDFKNVSKAFWQMAGKRNVILNCSCVIRGAVAGEAIASGVRPAFGPGSKPGWCQLLATAQGASWPDSGPSGFFESWAQAAGHALGKMGPSMGTW